MVEKNRTIEKAIEKIKDKDVRAIFETEKSYSADLSHPPEFFKEHEKSMRELLPTLYDEMLRRYEKIYPDICYLDKFLKGYIALEEKIIDLNKLSDADKIAELNLNYTWDKQTIDWTFFRKGLENGKFTIKDVENFCAKNPEHLKFFLPLLIECGDKSVWQTISKDVREAGQTDTLRICLFNAMLTTARSDALAYFIDEIEKNNYFRFKALGDVTTLLGDYDCSLPPAQVIAVFKDVLKNKQTEYLCRSFKENMYFQRAMKNLFPEAFTQYARTILGAGSSNARFALLHNLNSSSVSKQFAADIFGGELTIEDLSFLICKIDCKRIDRALLPTVFDKLLSICDGMDKVNYHYFRTEDISFARDVSKESVVSLLAEAAAALGEDKYFASLDARYYTFKEGAQATYLQTAKGRTKLDLRACVIRFLKTDNFTAVRCYDDMKIVLTYEEAVTVSEFLKTKKQSVKSKLVKEFLASPDKDKIRTYLLSAKEDYKVSVGKEMEDAAGKIQDYKLKQEHTYSYYTPQESVFALQAPQDEIDTILCYHVPTFERRSITLARLVFFFDTLAAFVAKNKDYEYKPWIGEGLITFGTDFQPLEPLADKDNLFAAYPLGEELKRLIRETLDEDEIISVQLLLNFRAKQAPKAYSKVYSETLYGLFDKSKPLFRFLSRENENEPCVTTSRGYLIRILLRLSSAIMHELLSERAVMELCELFSRADLIKMQKEDSVNTSYLHTKTLLFNLRNFLDALNCTDDRDAFKTAARSVCVLLENDLELYPSLELFAKLYENKFLSSRLLDYIILHCKIWLRPLSDIQSPLYLYRSRHPYPLFKQCMLGLIEDSVNAELSRGNLVTPYNQVIRGTECFLGAKYFVRAIAAMRGLTLVRSPYGSEKNESISMILKYTIKAEDDTFEQFAALLEEYKVTREELVRASLFNPSFIDFAERSLGIPRFKFAVYFFIAHLNEPESYGYDRLSECRKEAIKEYSDIDYRDFNDGAFDYKWYREMVENVPAEQIKMIYDNAKYVTVGGLHKRAQRFYDAMNGKITKEECLEKIKNSRDKTFCLVYSLIPLKDRQDLRERYIFLQDFIKESKKYGAQRQLSERRTVDIALENLARAAGYSDTNLFIFELEAEFTHDIYKTYTIDDVEITPQIAENSYKVTCTVKRNGKSISAIPSKYAKNETVVRLKEEIKQLNQKFRRISKSFEDAMCSKVVFTSEGLSGMSREKTISFVLSHLFFLADGKLSVFRDGALCDINGELVKCEKVYVAHPVELRKAGLLTQAMEYLVKNNVRQPFKQVLREIYMKSEEEQKQEEVLRFRGFNVDLKKCISALKGKGWGISEDIGLRKVYYSSDTVAALFRKFDELYLYDIENVDRELHGILFLNRKTEEVIPLKDVDDITFSETLRDVDLMITISANAIYDYDLAMSAVEIRREILKSVISILGLDNISFLKDNISVKGFYGTYLINIHTGLVFKEGKGNLLLDTIYSTDKPLLLDFIDEDPMTADIVSKAVVLSNDSAVRDPIVLREIKN